MTIRITQDPINNFFDNLPRYALDLKQQDDTARFRDKQLGENIRQFNEAQLQQQSQFSDTLEQRQDEFGQTMTQRKDEFGKTMDFNRDTLDFNIEKAMRTLDLTQQNVNLTERNVIMQEKLTKEGIDDRAFDRNRKFSDIALQDEIYRNLGKVESDARIAERDSQVFKEDNSAVFVQAEEYESVQDKGFGLGTINFLKGRKDFKTNRERIEYIEKEVGELKKYRDQLIQRGYTEQQANQAIMDGSAFSGPFNEFAPKIDLKPELIPELFETDFNKLLPEYDKRKEAVEDIINLKAPKLKVPKEYENFIQTNIGSDLINSYEESYQKTQNESINSLFKKSGGFLDIYNPFGTDVTGPFDSKQPSGPNQTGTNIPSTTGENPNEPYSFFNSLVAPLLPYGNTGIYDQYGGR
tara:strand:+ start:428 stop:1654 length:1227 start_codon:yes stop_codon:yes gene_type:complete